MDTWYSAPVCKRLATLATLGWEQSRLSRQLARMQRRG